LILLRKVKIRMLDMRAALCKLRSRRARHWLHINAWQ
jgi:hypothetical protein